MEIRKRSKRGDSLGDRQKAYENITNTRLVPKMPFIIRIDGHAFHTFTRGFRKPFDEILNMTMEQTALALCSNISGCRFGYTQSDEITLVVKIPNIRISHEYLGGRVEKINSLVASKATRYFNEYFYKNVEKFIEGHKGDEAYTELMTRYNRKLFKAEFDCRVFNVPEWDVINNLVWRQQDCIRNSIEMVGHANFSAKQLYKVNCIGIKEKLLNEKGIDWEEFASYQKYGTCIYLKEFEYKRNEKEDDIYTRKKWVVDRYVKHFIQEERKWFSEVTGLKEE